MKEFNTLFESWQYCQHLTTLPLEDLKNIPDDEIADLFFQAEKLLVKEVYLIAYELGFKPFDSWFVSNTKLGDYYGLHYGNVTIGFDSLFFSKDYNCLLGMIIHQLCRTKYAYRNKAFWELYDSCIKKKGLVSPEYNGWVIMKNKGSKYRMPFRKSYRFKGYDIIGKKLFEETWEDFYTLRPKYKQLHTYRYDCFCKETLPVCLCGEIKLRPVSQMIRQILDQKTIVLSDVKRPRSLALQDLSYLKDEDEVLCLCYDSRVKRDEDRMAYCVKQMKADDRYDISTYTSCFINLAVDESRPLNLEVDFEKLNEIPMPKDVRLLVSYSLTGRVKNLNKCEMMVVFSK